MSIIVSLKRQNSTNSVYLNTRIYPCICTYVYIYIYICIYIYIGYYILYIPVDLAVIIVFGSVIVAIHLPMLVSSAPTPLFLDCSIGTGIMGMFLWTAGSFCVFGERWDLTCLLQV